MLKVEIEWFQYRLIATIIPIFERYFWSLWGVEISIGPIFASVYSHLPKSKVMSSCCKSYWKKTFVGECYQMYIFVVERLFLSGLTFFAWPSQLLYIFSSLTESVWLYVSNTCACMYMCTIFYVIGNVYRRLANSWIYVSPYPKKCYTTDLPPWWHVIYVEMLASGLISERLHMPIFFTKHEGFCVLCIC
jgi:hypothetical protein